MIIPDIAIQEAIKQPGKTWQLDFSTGRVSGQMIDGNAAVAQTAQSILLSERFAYLIYSWAFGSELRTLLGQDGDYVHAEAPRMIREALMQDDRITGVRDFVFNGTNVEFTLDTVYGSQRISTEVTA